MTDIRTEKTFESAIVERLVEQGGYIQGNADEYGNKANIVAIF